MNTQRLKTELIAILGEKATAYIHGLRFAHLLRKRKTWDAEVRLLPAFLRSGDTAVDIGANGCDWTYCLHQLTGPKGAVFAFEADPYYALATRFTMRLMRLRGAHLFPFGLSSKDEVVPLRIADSQGLRLSGYGHVDKNAQDADDHVITVQLRSLDSVAKEHSKLLETRLIKCDVEGYELFVFQGAEGVLAASRPVVILEVGHYEQHGYTAQDVYDLFAEKEYSCFAMVDSDTLAATDSMMNHDNAISHNRVLIPNEDVASVPDTIRIAS